MPGLGYFSKYDPTAEMRKLLQTNKVVIISTTTCPYCTVAQEQFDKLAQPTLKYELDTMPDRNRSYALFRDVVSKTDNQGTVPKVFVCGKYVGGGTEAEKMYKKGTLKQMLDKCDMDQLASWKWSEISEAKAPEGIFWK